jgi:hypothetical protein
MDIDNYNYASMTVSLLYIQAIKTSKQNIQARLNEIQKKEEK